MAKPQIRLNGFNDEWADVILGDLFKERNEFDINAEMLSVTINQGIIRASENGRFDNSNNDKSHYRLVKRGDIAYNSMRMWQGASGYSNYEGIVSPAYTVLKPVEGIFSPFFATLFKTLKMIRVFRLNSQGLTSDTWNLKYPAFSRINVTYPKSLTEQEGIAEYFRSLDDLIKGSAKKLDSLKQMKAACLQSMFPQPWETVPQVRFKGFTGDWETKMLNECLDISTEKNLDNTFGINDVLSVSDDFGVVNQIQLLGRSYAGKSVSNYGILKRGEIVYTKSPLSAKPYGIVKYNSGDTGIVSVLYAIYRAKEGVSAEFIHYYFDPAWRLNAYLRPLVNKGAKNTMNISDEMALNGTIIIPSDPQEQEQIASFFSELDAQIRLHEQRLEKLKQIKASCLDKMFV